MRADPILPKEPITDEWPLKLLHPSINLPESQGVGLPRSIVFSTSSCSFAFGFAATKRAMFLLQNGQTGAGDPRVTGFGLLWQHNPNVH